MRVTEIGVETTDAEYELDVIILATGYDALTGPLLRLNLEGRDGVTLEEHWRDGPRTLYGRMIHGFPNLFISVGPQSPSALYSNYFQAQDVADWAAGLISHMKAVDLLSVEPIAAAEERWSDHTAELAEGTMFAEANSWCMGANVPGKPRKCLVYLGGGVLYNEEVARATANGYRGFGSRPPHLRAPQAERSPTATERQQERLSEAEVPDRAPRRRTALGDLTVTFGTGQRRADANNQPFVASASRR